MDVTKVMYMKQDGEITARGEVIAKYLAGDRVSILQSKPDHITHVIFTSGMSRGTVAYVDTSLLVEGHELDTRIKLRVKEQRDLEIRQIEEQLLEAQRKLREVTVNCNHEEELLVRKKGYFEDGKWWTPYYCTLCGHWKHVEQEDEE